MLQSVHDSHTFRLGRSAFQRVRLLSVLLLSAFLICAAASTALGIWLWPHYAHTFVPYLKWQDALEALFWYISAISLGGCILVVRFLFALYAGYHHKMVTLIGETELIVRDLSSKNLASIFWMVSTALSCFVAGLLGLLPVMLIGWTLHLPNQWLVILGTTLAILLGLAGLVITLPAFSFVVIGCVGSISFGRKLGSAQPYHLTSQAKLMIDGFVLTIINPDAPESMIDLHLLTPEDQRLLLDLLHKRWLEADRPWNPGFGEEIALALSN